LNQNATKRAQLRHTGKFHATVTPQLQFTLTFLPYTVKSPGRTSRLAYIRRHISTSGNAQFDAELAQLETMEKCFPYADNQVRKTNHFSTETLISGHNCCNRMRATPHFHFRIGAKCRQTCTA